MIIASLHVYFLWCEEISSWFLLSPDQFYLDSALANILDCARVPYSAFLLSLSSSFRFLSWPWRLFFCLSFSTNFCRLFSGDFCATPEFSDWFETALVSLGRGLAPCILRGSRGSSLETPILTADPISEESESILAGFYSVFERFRAALSRLPPFIYIY